MRLDMARRLLLSVAFGLASNGFSIYRLGGSKTADEYINSMAKSASGKFKATICLYSLFVLLKFHFSGGIAQYERSGHWADENDCLLPLLGAILHFKVLKLTGCDFYYYNLVPQRSHPKSNWSWNCQRLEPIWLLVLVFVFLRFCMVECKNYLVRISKDERYRPGNSAIPKIVPN
jgi:hypothetical protein